MYDVHKETLTEVFLEVLEKLVFMFGEPVDKDNLPEPGNSLMEVTATFEGDLCGVLKLVVPAEICPQIAANMLGTDPDDASAVEKGVDALNELLNVTCGQVLTALGGTKPIFDVSVPVAAELGANAWRDMLRQRETEAFQVEDWTVLLSLSLCGSTK